MSRSKNTVTVSPKYQVVIPEEIRSAARLKPGTRVQVFHDAGRIWLIPVVPPKHIRGLVPGLDSRVDRDDDRV